MIVLVFERGGERAEVYLPEVTVEVATVQARIELPDAI